MTAFIALLLRTGDVYYTTCCHDTRVKDAQWSAHCTHRPLLDNKYLSLVFTSQITEQTEQ